MKVLIRNKRPESKSDRHGYKIDFFLPDENLPKHLVTHQSGFNTVSFNLQNPNGTTDALCGTYGVVIDTEALRTSDSDRLYSGLNTIGQVIAIQASYETVPAPMLVDCYGQFTMSILLDMSPSGTGTFTVAI